MTSAAARAPWPAGQPTDEELINEVRTGNTEAYGTLYERHIAAARNLARQLSRCADDENDLISEAFAQVLTQLRQGKGPDTLFRAYLLTTMRHVAYDRTRRYRRLVLVDDITHDSQVDPAKTVVPWIDTATVSLNRSMAAQAFERLPERWQVVLWLTVVEELPPGEVAPIIHLTPNGVSALAYRAREGLRQAWLQAHLPDDGYTWTACTSACSLLGAWIRGATNKRETAQVHQHINWCVPCWDRAAQLADVNAELVRRAGTVAEVTELAHAA
jgi:RNA polymerase sigma factor (sigma-70 family)